LPRLFPEKITALKGAQDNEAEDGIEKLGGVPYHVDDTLRMMIMSGSLNKDTIAKGMVLYENGG
jgi:hypothetical protein